MAKLIRVEDDVFARFAYVVGQLHLKYGRFVSASEAEAHLLDKWGAPKKVGKRLGKQLAKTKTRRARSNLKKTKKVRKLRN